MRLFLAGCLAVSSAWLWDHLLRFLGWSAKNRIGIGIPIGEEIIKFSLAVGFNLPPWLFYACFGLGEGCWEACALKDQSKTLLVLAGILTHSIFGVFFLFNISYGISFGLGVALHLIWNNLLIRVD